MSFNLSTSTAAEAGSQPPAHAVGQSSHHTHYAVIAGVSVGHMLNDIMQSLIVTVYPLLSAQFHLSFVQIGLITLTFQMTASLLQPIVGMVTDRYPLPYATLVGMCFTLTGVILLSVAPNYAILLLAVALIGCGSSIFHPQSAQVARTAAGGRYGLAQSLFQIGGNTGQALGPIVAGALVLQYGLQGRTRIAWFTLAALIGIVILLQVSRWYAHHLDLRQAKRRHGARRYPKPVVRRTIGVLFILMVSKFFYLASINSYYEFFLIHRFGLSDHNAAYLLGVFLLAVAGGTLIGGPLGDRIGRKWVIWFSILGCAPFTLMLPYVGLGWTVALSVIIGLVLASAYPAIIVYAQDMLTHRIGMISGLFYGFSFGLGGLGAALFGEVADRYGIDFVYQVSSFLPLIGLLAVFLPDVRPPASEEADTGATGTAPLVNSPAQT